MLLSRTMTSSTWLEAFWVLVMMESVTSYCLFGSVSSGAVSVTCSSGSGLGDAVVGLAAGVGVGVELGIEAGVAVSVC